LIFSSSGDSSGSETASSPAYPGGEVREPSLFQERFDQAQVHAVDGQDDELAVSDVPGRAAAREHIVSDAPHTLTMRVGGDDLVATQSHEVESPPILGTPRCGNR
jgi:hypothetical protein